MQVGLNTCELRELAYHLVTYAIEMRAKELYTIYDHILRIHRSKVTIKSILLEEEEHLDEMHAYLMDVPNGRTYIAHACSTEAILCQEWIENIKKETGWIE